MHRNVSDLEKRHGGLRPGRLVGLLNLGGTDVPRCVTWGGEAEFVNAVFGVQTGQVRGAEGNHRGVIAAQ